MMNQDPAMARRQVVLQTRFANGSNTGSRESGGRQEWGDQQRRGRAGEPVRRKWRREPGGKRGGQQGGSAVEQGCGEFRRQHESER